MDQRKKKEPSRERPAPGATPDPSPGRSRDPFPERQPREILSDPPGEVVGDPPRRRHRLSEGRQAAREDRLARMRSNRVSDLRARRARLGHIARGLGSWFLASGDTKARDLIAPTRPMTHAGRRSFS
jgi:hypothetical protein